MRLPRADGMLGALASRPSPASLHPGHLRAGTFRLQTLVGSCVLCCSRASQLKCSLWNEPARAELHTCKTHSHACTHGNTHTGTHTHTRADAFKKAPCLQNGEIANKDTKDMHSSAGHTHSLWTLAPCSLSTVHLPRALTQPQDTSGAREGMGLS